MWWESHGSSNGFDNNLKQTSPITIATMAYLKQMNTIRIVVKKGKLRVFQELVHRIRMREQNVQSKP